MKNAAWLPDAASPANRLSQETNPGPLGSGDNLFFPVLASTIEHKVQGRSYPASATMNT